MQQNRYSSGKAHQRNAGKGRGSKAWMSRMSSQMRPPTWVSRVKKRTQRKWHR
jgi:hypothetical protein